MQFKKIYILTSYIRADSKNRLLPLTALHKQNSNFGGNQRSSGASIAVSAPRKGLCLWSLLLVIESIHTVFLVYFIRICCDLISFWKWQAYSSRASKTSKTHQQSTRCMDLFFLQFGTFSTFLWRSPPSFTCWTKGRNWSTLLALSAPDFTKSFVRLFVPEHSGPISSQNSAFPWSTIIIYFGVVLMKSKATRDKKTHRLRLSGWAPC